jgi:hypothetical protein
MNEIDSCAAQIRAVDRWFRALADMQALMPASTPAVETAELH